MEPSMFLDEFRPFRRGELALCRRLARDPLFLSPSHSDRLRYALRLAQLSTLGREPGDLVHLIGSLRLRMLQLLAPVLPTEPDQIEAAELIEVLPRIARLVREARALILERALVPEKELDEQIATKQLVLVMGGAAGSGYAYLGALEQLERLGVRPRYLVGSSMGAVLGVVRARSERFEPEEVYEELRRVRAEGVFRPPDPTTRYGLPAALRLDLRRALGPLFTRGDEPLRLGELALPLDVMTTGLGPGAFTGSREEFAELVAIENVEGLAHLRAGAIARLVGRLVSLAMSRQVLVPLCFGQGTDTGALAALDAAGFSAAIPGLLSYDLGPDDETGRALIDPLFERHGLIGLVDGSLTSLLPARHAWTQIEAGRIGSRHAAILALDAVTQAGGTNRLIAPFLRVVTASAQRDKAYWDLHLAFRQGPPLLDLFPSEARLRRASDDGETEFQSIRSVLQNLLAPVPPWRELEASEAA